MKYVPFALLILLVFCLQTLQANELAVGWRAPDFSLKQMGGNMVSLSNFSGKPVLLIFWATWCPSCREEIPQVKKAFEEYKGKNLAFLSVNVGQKESAVSSFAKREQIPYPILLDQDKSVTHNYKIKGIPHVLLLDRKGIVRYNGFGLPGEYQVLLDQIIKKG